MKFIPDGNYILQSVEHKTYLFGSSDLRWDSTGKQSAKFDAVSVVNCLRPKFGVAKLNCRIYNEHGNHEDLSNLVQFFSRRSNQLLDNKIIIRSLRTRKFAKLLSNGKVLAEEEYPYSADMFFLEPM